MHPGLDPLSDTRFVNFFSHSVCGFFSHFFAFLMMSFVAQKFIVLMKSNLFLLLLLLLMGWYPRRCPMVQGHEDLLPCLL